MAALIRDLQKRFPKTQILGHYDLPGIGKESPCYDVAKDHNKEKSSQSLKTLPQIRGTPMHRGQKSASKPRGIYARGEEQESDLRDIHARGAEIFLRFEAHLCTPCNDMSEIQDTPYPGWNIMPQIQGRSLHTMQNYAPNSRQTFPRSEYHVQDSGHAIPRSEYHAPDSGLAIPRSEYRPRDSGQAIPWSEYRPRDSGHVFPIT